MWQLPLVSIPILMNMHAKQLYSIQFYLITDWKQTSDLNGVAHCQDVVIHPPTIWHMVVGTLPTYRLSRSSLLFLLIWPASVLLLGMLPGPVQVKAVWMQPANFFLANFGLSLSNVITTSLFTSLTLMQKDFEQPLLSWVALDPWGFPMSAHLSYKLASLVRAWSPAQPPLLHRLPVPSQSFSKQLAVCPVQPVTPFLCFSYKRKALCFLLLSSKAYRFFSFLL